MPCICGCKEECNCFKIVEVLWWDTNETSNSGWMSLAETKKNRPCKVKSIGYLVNETDELITIAADTDGHTIKEDAEDLLGRVQCFPKGCIIDIKYLS
jgi:hypothetical protein